MFSPLDNRILYAFVHLMTKLIILDIIHLNSFIKSLLIEHTIINF
jgi:hypothetical protein